MEHLHKAMAWMAGACNAEALGWLAALLMVWTFAAREPRTMRSLAVATNIAFFAYGVAASLAPVLVLHALLLPINLWRWSECALASERGSGRILRPSAERSTP